MSPPWEAQRRERMIARFHWQSGASLSLVPQALRERANQLRIKFIPCAGQESQERVSLWPANNPPAPRRANMRTMAATYAESCRLVRTLAKLAGSEVLAASKRTACRVVFALGLGNLLAGLVFGNDGWLPAFVALDIVYANFAWSLWIVAVYLGGQPPLAGFGKGIAAKSIALAVVVAVMLTVAGAVAVAVQLWRGTAPLDAMRHATGLYANLGVSTLHLALLAVATQAIIGRRWLSMGATAAVWIGLNLGFDQPLLRFGAPISPSSGMNGFGPFLALQTAAGIHWTGACVVLLAAGRSAVGLRSATRAGRVPRRLGPNAFAVVWTAAVAWVVSGGWLYYQTHIANDRTAAAARDPITVPPQPDYSRFDLDITISPLERTLVSRGTMIAVNRLDLPVAELHFAIPPMLEVVRLKMTGEFAGIDDPGGGGPRSWRYRLNRPLEPKETLKIEYEVRWVANDFAEHRRATRLVGNGTIVSTADIVPALGHVHDGHPFHKAPPVAYRARVGTSLDQIAVTAGTLVGAWKENGWSFFEYDSLAPIPPLTTIHSGHYAIQRVAEHAGSIEVYYHPPHQGRVAYMVDAGRAALARWAPLAADAQGVVRVVEVPEYRPFRRLGFLGFDRKPAVDEVRPGMVLPYSERGYPLSTPPPSGSTPRQFETATVTNLSQPVGLALGIFTNYTYMNMQFEWDDGKGRANAEKHGVDFATAQRIFDGPVLTRPDTRRDYGEVRHVSVGRAGPAVIVVAHTRRGDRLRLISARPASRKERKSYRERIQKDLGTG